MGKEVMTDIFHWANQIDSMAIELMTDNAGAIILFDSKDVGVFLDIVNDNYLTSETGNSYLAKSKKLIAPSE